MTNEVKEAVQDYYDEDFSWCYGCGRLNEKGHHFRTGWDGEHTVTVYEPQPEHMALPGFVYGGLIASMMDCHGTGSASIGLHHKNGYAIGEGPEPPRFVTASLHVDYMKPTPQDVALTAYGKITEIHPKKWQVDSEIYAGDTLCCKGQVIAAVMPKDFQA